MRKRSAKASSAAKRWLFAISLATALSVGPLTARADEFRVDLVAPGMNQTDLTAVLGPATYIQVKGLRQAWQYCPRRFIIRFLDEYVRREAPIFVTVWFDNGRVKHMRVYPGERMGECEDFLSAFRWEDEIDGGMVEFDGGRRIK